MSTLYLTVPGADFSADRIGFLPGLDLHAPYGAYLLGSGYGGANGARHDHSGNGRTLTDTGTPVIAAGYMTGAYANHFNLPFSMTTLLAGGAATVLAVARNTAGSQQLIGNIAASGNYMALSVDAAQAKANMNSPARSALRSHDAGTTGLWAIHGARFAANNLDLLFYRSDLGSTVIVDAGAFSSQPLTDASNLKIGGSEVNTWTANPDIAAVLVFNTALSDVQFDEVRDMLIGLLAFYDIAI